ncbi:hypothetical protein ScPMuIL_010224 [Solemya velum]
MEMQNGYPVEIFAENFDTKFKCNQCRKILREPVQSFCGHRFCKSCIESVVRNNEIVHCQTCIEEGNTDENYSILKTDQMFPDNAVRREMAGMATCCMFPGCTWKGTFKAFEHHIHECIYKPLSCPDCGQTVNAATIEQHRNEECVNRKIKCKYCGVVHSANNVKAHTDECPKYPVKCTTCNQKKKIPRDELQQHMDRQCPTRQIECPVCNKQFRRLEFGKHFVRDEAQDHMLWIMEQIMKLQQAVNHGITGATPMSSIEEIAAKVTELENKILEQAQVLQASVNQISTRNGSSSQGDSDQLRERMQAQELKTSTFEQIVTTLHREIERCLVAIETGDRQRNVDRETMEQTTVRIKNLERQLALKDIAMAEQDLRIKSLELSSYDGSLLWKLPDFGKKRIEAIKGKTTSIYSPVFHTSRTGYKMCARLYPNGDGMGKGTHVSLFFVLMRGHYDDILTWPFQERVTFMLLDQNGKDHVVDSFRPDPSSSSFKKPVSEMNIASGCPLLLPLVRLDDQSTGYVKNDTMFVKVLVDCSNIKKV